jgi:hypothetical protein
MVAYLLNLSYESHVSGNRKHGTIYPNFSAIVPSLKITEGENLSAQQELRITCEDGRFTKANNRIGYTGQHTDLYEDYTVQDRQIILLNPLNGKSQHATISSYLYVKIYTRNKYGGKLSFCRLDLETRKIQRPIVRNGVCKWYDFDPSNYID